MDIFLILVFALGVFIWYMLFDYLVVKFFKLSEVRAVWYSFILIVILFILYSIFTPPIDYLKLLIRLGISIIFLGIFIPMAKKDDAKLENPK